MRRDLIALRRFIAGRENTPFAWGKNANDCASFARAAVIAQTGKDPLRRVKKWSDAKGAATIIAQHGGIEAVADKALRRIPVSRAVRGDVAAVKDDRHGVSLAIVEGDMLVGPGDKGNLRLPRSAMIAAWSAD